MKEKMKTLNASRFVMQKQVDDLLSQLEPALQESLRINIASLVAVNVEIGKIEGANELAQEWRTALQVGEPE